MDLEERIEKGIKMVRERRAKELREKVKEIKLQEVEDGKWREKIDEDGKAIVSRGVAEARGWNKYYTGVRCKHGHKSERYVYGGACVECRKKRNRKKNK